MALIDTHTHLYLPEFDEDRDAMMQRAFDAGVQKLYLPNIESASVESMLQLSAKYPKQCFPMMGLHPCSVKENVEQELAGVEEYLFRKKNVKAGSSAGDPAFYAVGEIGLDYYWDRTFVPQQQGAFREQIRWAKQLHLPIVIHSRDSTDDCIKIVRELKDENLRGIFHCFSGTLEQAKQIIDLGFYLGIGGVVTFKNSGLDRIVAQLDLKHLVLETDSPYLAPVPFRGKRNETAYITYVVKKIAEVKNCSEEEVAKATTENAEKIFSKF